MGGTNRQWRICVKFQSAPSYGERHRAAGLDRDRNRPDRVSIRALLRRATRHVAPSCIPCRLHVSIRALLRRATATAGTGPQSLVTVFQSAPSYGERLPGRATSLRPLILSFNPRPPTESDRQVQSHSCRRRDRVSIRALLRRATRNDIAMTQTPPACFNPRPPAESDDVSSGRVGRTHRCFNPRPPTESDCGRESIPGRTRKRFQSAPSYGERPPSPNRVTLFVDTECFNPRPPTESDLPGGLQSVDGGPVFQSTPPCGERHGAMRHRKRGYYPVSIRALLRRATTWTQREKIGMSFRCFNPRPPTESDRARLRRRHPERSGFNPRPPTESDAGLDRFASPLNGCFNPRPPTESDRAPDRRWRIRPKMFQSTPPCGERLGSGFMALPRDAGFNPRPPTESDGERRCDPNRFQRRFQSAPSYGERQGPYLIVPDARATCFNPRPPAESDESYARWWHLGVHVSIRALLRRATALLMSGSKFGQERFQSTPPCGERRSPIRNRNGSMRFQSAPSYGERRGPNAPVSLVQNVSIRALLRRATLSV